MVENWLKLCDIAPENVTPMVRQFIGAKDECGDSLLFFRMGDFYELFFEDALEASSLLGLTLTSRDGVGKEARIPMCGVPVRSVDSYVAKAIKAGRTVSICDQVEDPKLAKGIVKRAVVRTVTRGTVMEGDLLDADANNYLCAIFPGESECGLAFVDVSTGEFLVAQVPGYDVGVLADELSRMAPVEVLLPATFDGDHLTGLCAQFESITFATRDAEAFDSEQGRVELLGTYGLSTLKGVDLEDAQEAVSCAGALLVYIRETQRDGVPQLQLPRRYSPSGFVVLDGNTQRNLELVTSLGDKTRQGTLLGVLDRTRTSMGGRKLRHWILHPLLDVGAIQGRLRAVEVLFEDTERRLQLQEALREVSDLERLLGRITSKSGNGRDVKALGNSIGQVPALRGMISGAGAPLLEELYESLDELTDVASWICAAIVASPPVTLMEGNLIEDGYDGELDRLHELVRGGKNWIASLQREERARTGIQNLKVGYNKVFGYFIEVSKGNTHLVPEDYDRKQTLVNAERYVTVGLKEREEEILTAQERMQSLEYDLFVALRDRIGKEGRRIQSTAEAIAVLDVLLSLADVAVKKQYCKPALSESSEIDVREGRHPVVEDLMSPGEFVPNDTFLDGEKGALQIVTGPNMAGKSTYLRQVALITLMAQMGSFVPAARASVGIVDRIFTRVGASDNLVRGESTFMVEMIETANILNTATRKSLLVLDEIGRGTSTFDGISIAWSVAEHIHDKIRAKTLFATHYHELTALGDKLEHAKNLNVAVREWGDKIVFLYRIVEGGADHSYGIQVAKLAGLPSAMLDRAREILDSLEAGNQGAAGLPEQMYLFGATPTAEPSVIEKELEVVDPDSLSPREAQEFLYHLKHLVNKPRSK